ncbi:MAG: FG-GAP-like repeat-containing protein [Pirellula sp.]
MRASRWIILFAFLATSSIVSVLWIATRETAPTDRTYSAAKTALQQGDFNKAINICNDLLAKQNDAPNLLLIAGEAASRIKRYDESIAYYDRVPDSARGDASLARWAAGEVLLETKRMSASIRKMEQSLALDAGNDKARDRLIYMLNVSGQRWDASPHLLELVRQNRWSVQHLLYLGNLAMPVENEKELNGFLADAPKDPLPLLGLARIRLREGATEQAKLLLDQVLQLEPNLVEAHVQSGMLLLQKAPHDIPKWNHSLPKNADLHPGIWLIRGEWARDHSQSEAALRCFAESTRLDPDNLAALNALAQSLAAIGQTERAPTIAQRASQLEKLAYVFERIMTNEWSGRQAIAQHKISDAEYQQYLRSKERLEPILNAAKTTLDLGRIWEANAWIQYGLSFDSGHIELRQLAQRAAPRMDRRLPRTELEKPLLELAWVQSLIPPIWDLSNMDRSSIASDAPQKSGQIRFAEESDAFNFTYYASRTVFEDGRRMFEMTGGGVGILDYDLDGWPDVFLAQGCDWPADVKDRSHSDRLKRNRGAMGSDLPVFEDVSHRAGIMDHAFGHGVAIGDIDSDGFDDVYVCNFGSNQLWLNQGDGTFRDGSFMMGNPSVNWTISAAIADLNGDGSPEIYDANYVQGPDVDTRRCLYKGLPRACSPQNFSPAKGRLMALDEAAMFRDVGSHVLAPEIREGNAMGLSVLRVRGHRYPSIFVANDQVANLMLTALPESKSPLGIRLEDQALLQGLAYDSDGKAQACMGIASGDVDGDGLIDLLVTNYYDEPNTLYLQQSSGVFRDATKASGLIAPSLKMLGFGTQFLDANLDGIGDLVVLNGHIDDMSHAGIPFRMRAQFFSGDGRGRFAEQRADEVGPFFEPERLARALALIDFDRDGRQDFIATDLERPTVLVRNESQAGGFLTVRLVGVASHRDAIGTELIATAAGRSWTQQLTGGSGYMVSNQKMIHFGLASANKIDRLEIDWPSGVKQTFSDLAINTHWLAIEGQNLVRLP